MSVDWKQVEEWRVATEPDTLMLLSTTGELNQDVVDAKEKELANLKKNEVFDEIPFSNQRTISSRWVFTEKNNDGKRTVKARLVARGFEENSEGYRTDSPTCSKHALRTVMMTASTNRWKINSIDVASAFLQGNRINREVYLRPPSDVCSKEHVWRLKRCIYGLNDAPREWYNKVTEELILLGAVRSKLDNAMFMWYNDKNEVIGHLVSHVDDFVYGGTEKWQEDVIENLKRKFSISAECHGTFKYLGLNIKQSDSGIDIDQSDYVERLQEIPITNERKLNVDEILTSNERSEMRAASGKMLWITNQTRPDMAYETCMASNLGKSPTVRKILETNKAIRKMKNSNNICVRFPNVGKMMDTDIVVFCDATHASLPDGSSQGAFIVFVRGKDKVVPILWQSKKLKRVTKSPLASETHALGEAADAALLIANLIVEIYHLDQLPKITCYTDSKSLRDALHTSNTLEDMSLRVNVARLREMVNLEEITVKWIHGNQQLADVMTKRGASADGLLRVLSNSTL